MKIYVILSLACALVALGECQELTSMIFHAMGIEAPPMMPTMPVSLRNHIYGRQRQQQLVQQQQKQQRYLAYLLSQQQRQQKANPYSIPRAQPLSNSVYSSANRIRLPGSTNTLGSKANPYSSSFRDTSYNRVGSKKSGNPYSTSRAAGSGIPVIRNRAALNAALSPVPVPPMARNFIRTMQTMRAVREQPLKLMDAKSVGCRMPSESPMSSVLMYSDCRNPASRMVCESEMMSCVNVGMSGICCPFGINNLALDTVSYVNKLQHFVSELGV